MYISVIIGKLTGVIFENKNVYINIKNTTTTG